MRVLLTLIMLCSLPGFASSWTQQQLADFTAATALYFAVESNQLAEPMQFAAAIELDNQSNLNLPAGAAHWQIYFHLIRRIDTTEQQGLRIEHVQGDLHRISPTAAFAGLPAGQQLRLGFNSAPWMVSYTDFMPRAFMQMPTLNAEVFTNTDTEDLTQFVRPLRTAAQLQRNFGSPDKVAIATADNRFAANLSLNAQGLTADNSQLRIIPTPQQAKFSKKRIQITNLFPLLINSPSAYKTF